jgi:hypothetical protein
MTAITLVNGARAQFAQSVQKKIDYLVDCRTFTLLLGVVKVAQSYGLEIGVFDAYIEWIAFNTSFVIFGLLALVMPYWLKVQKNE